MMLKFGLHPWIRSEEDLACVIETATPLFVDLKFVLGPKVSKTGFAPVHFVSCCEIAKECREVLDPRIMLLPVEEVYAFGVFLLRDVERVSIPPIAIVDTKDIDGCIQLVFDVGNIRDPHWVRNLVESVARE